MAFGKYVEMTEPSAIRALAHPARMAILAYLDEGPATATECSTAADESPSACSYHLRTLARLTGRGFPAIRVPKRFMLGVGSAADAVQRRTRTRMPWSRESVWIVNCAARCDDARARAELGFEPRPIEETFADTVRWLVAAGHVTPRQAGRLAPS